MSPQLELSTFLAAIRRRWRLLTALRAGTVAMAGLTAAFGLFALFARAAHPTADVLLAIGALALVAGVAWVGRSIRSMGLPDDRRLARFIEERRPEFEDGLVTAVEMRHRRQAFGAAVVADAVLRARAVAPSSIVASEEIKQAAGRSLAACALLLLAGGASWGPAAQALDAARVRLFPSRISILVEPGNTRVIAGESLTLRARVRGVPRGFDAHPTVSITSGAASRRQAMSASGDGFELRMNAVSASFKYDVTAAGVRSPGFAVTVLHRPALQQIDVSYRYPAYTGMPPRDEEDSGDIYAPAGTRVTIRAHASKQLTAGTLRLGDQSIPLQPDRDPRVRQTSFTVQRNGSYRIDLTDADGLRSDPSSEYFVRVTDDRPPEVRIVRPESDRQVTPLEEVEIEAQAEDDYQVGSLELVYAVGAQPERTVVLGRAAGPSLSGRHLLPLEDLKVQAGDMVRAFARAREARKGGRETRSEMLLLEVTPFDQQFAFAQSQAGAGGGGGEVESLIQAQKNILNGTWNLLRRSVAGRSDADVRSLSAGQTELKKRAEAQAGGAGAGTPRGPGAGGSASPLAQAAAAMGRAAETLQRARLQDAVPHEMEALTQLGRALAEDKRRQVTQQRGGGGGGGSGASEDLSTLFDRELLRQQQTNYENRNTSSSEASRDRESDLQKRIRELAQKQDDLAREQRRLAQQQGSEEERRRQLERLTREQEELRQQAEQLARDMQRQQTPGRRQGSADQSQSLRDAADDMRASSGDMRRNDAQSASQRGSRAADRLRSAQQPSAEGEGQPQSIGELQMEAQQLSEAQRRMEEQRATGEGGASQKSADEQRRLADRADRLRRAAQALAGGRGEQKARQAAGQAARELERERVAERMRDEAERMRAGGDRGPRPPETPAGGSRLSSTLDRVARQLGAGADPATRKLAEEMARNRSAREQLETTARRLERAQREGNTEAQGELRQELQRAEQMLRELEQKGDRPESGMGRTAPEEHEWSRSAPGLESFKQDFARWEQLKRDVALALEKRDLSLAQQLKRGAGGETVTAGSVEGLPESYRARVSKYFEALARASRRPQP